MNVLIYVFDALRADSVGAYGYERNTTPHLDSLADEGLLFNQCIAPATWTRPSAASLLSGMYPPAHGTRDMSDNFTPPVPSLAEQFDKAGYQTVAIGSMPNIRGDWGFNRGFDDYVELFADSEIKQRRKEIRPDVPLVRAHDLTEAALEWIHEANSNDPFFMLAWSNETHSPYDPPAEFRTYIDDEYDGPVDGSPETLSNARSQADKEHLRSLYDGEVQYNDAAFGELLEGLHEHGIYEETIIIAIGDHGDGLGEHPGFFGHGVTPYEELIRVPCIVKSPYHKPQRVANPVSLVDIYPSLVDYLQLSDEINEIPVQGVSWKQVISGEETANRTVFVEGNTHSETSSYQVARGQQWKIIKQGIPDLDDRRNKNSLVRNYFNLAKKVLNSDQILDIIFHPAYYWRRHMTSEEIQIFDLDTDPEEMNNLAKKRPEKRDDLVRKLQKWYEDCYELNERLNVNTSKVNIDDASERRLKALGYLEEE
jgi:arylsulfatase A-like enzyme